MAREKSREVFFCSTWKKLMNLSESKFWGRESNLATRFQQNPIINETGKKQAESRRGKKPRDRNLFQFQRRYKKKLKRNVAAHNVISNVQKMEKTATLWSFEFHTASHLTAHELTTGRSKQGVSQFF